MDDWGNNYEKNTGNVNTLPSERFDEIRKGSTRQFLVLQFMKTACITGRFVRVVLWYDRYNVA